MITFRDSAKFDQEATIIFLDQHQVKDKKFPFYNKQIQDTIESLQQANQFSGEKDQFFPLYLNKQLILLVGLGKSEDLSSSSTMHSIKKTILSSYLSKIKTIELVGHSKEENHIKDIIEGILIGTYSWKKYKGKSKNDSSVDEKDIVIIAPKKKVYDEAIQICEGVKLSRDLINDNADVVTSAFLEKTVLDLIKGKKQCKIEILGKKEMEAKGLGLHLAVNQGSRNEPKLIIVKYTGDPKSKDYIALVGKGMTFDTGGLNLKPTGSIETMRSDMSGTSAVIGVLKNALSLNLKKNVLFVTAIAENVIGSGAFKPGDVFRSYLGKTVEIANTDAEGRLVLADAIAYVIKNYQPKQLIDIATLTGACVVALGHYYTGLVTTNDELSEKIVRSSNETDDRVWRMPIYPELKEAVKSQVADIRNLGFAKGAAGALTAAEFLRQFASGTIWAHLDIAGTSFVDGHCRSYYSHGATGAGVRLLTHFLQNN